MEFGHQKRNVKSLEAHENHNEPTRFNNDVAIITVTEPFDFSDPNVQPIEWFKKDDPEIPGETICNATGKVIYQNYYKNSHEPGTFWFRADWTVKAVALKISYFNSRVFLQCQIWIVNYYIKKFVRKPQNPD